MVCLFAATHIVWHDSVWTQFLSPSRADAEQDHRSCISSDHCRGDVSFYQTITIFRILLTGWTTIDLFHACLTIWLIHTFIVFYEIYLFCCSYSLFIYWNDGLNGGRSIEQCVTSWRILLADLGSCPGSPVRLTSPSVARWWCLINEMCNIFFWEQ